MLVSGSECIDYLYHPSPKTIIIQYIGISIYIVWDTKEPNVFVCGIEALKLLVFYRRELIQHSGPPQTTIGSIDKL